MTNIPEALHSAIRDYKEGGGDDTFKKSEVVLITDGMSQGVTDALVKQVKEFADIHVILIMSKPVYKTSEDKYSYDVLSKNATTFQLVDRKTTDLSKISTIIIGK
jgi:uncharacterized protein with von Willebrand factor type A (vWA) domain